MRTHTPRFGKIGLFTLLIAALAGAGAGAAAVYFWSISKIVPNTRQALVEPLSQSAVAALGRLRPAGGILTLAGPMGDQIAQVLVKEGETVPKDKELLIFASREDRKAELELIDQQLTDAEAQRKLAEDSGNREILVSQAKLKDMDELSPLEIKSLKAKVQLLDRQREVATARLKNMKDLQRSSPNTVSAQEIESQELLLVQAEAELEANKVLVEKAEKSQITGRKVAEAQLEAAKSNLQRALREIPVETLMKKRQIAEMQFRRTALLAPIAGTIVKLFTQKGDLTSPQQPILQLADTERMQVIAEVYETDIKRLREWQKSPQGVRVLIRSKAFPASSRKDQAPAPAEITGRITAIGTVIARNTVFDLDPTADADRRVFEVTIEVDPQYTALAAQYLNLQVQVQFEQKSSPSTRE